MFLDYFYANIKNNFRIFVYVSKHICTALSVVKSVVMIVFRVFFGHKCIKINLFYILKFILISAY